MIAAKVQEGGGQGGDKSHTDKNKGDFNKLDVATPCQCVCHNRAKSTTATTAARADVVDLTESPCKKSGQPPPPAPGHSKYFFSPSFYLCWHQKHSPLFSEPVYLFTHLSRNVFLLAFNFSKDTYRQRLSTHCDAESVMSYYQDIFKQPLI